MNHTEQSCAYFVIQIIFDLNVYHPIWEIEIPTSRWSSGAAASGRRVNNVKWGAGWVSKDFEAILRHQHVAN